MGMLRGNFLRHAQGCGEMASTGWFDWFGWFSWNGWIGLSGSGVKIAAWLQ